MVLVICFSQVSDSYTLIFKSIQFKHDVLWSNVSGNQRKNNLI